MITVKKQNKYARGINNRSVKKWMRKQREKGTVV
jgi:hypothetical protein